MKSGLYRYLTGERGSTEETKTEMDLMKEKVLERIKDKEQNKESYMVRRREEKGSKVVLLLLHNYLHLACVHKCLEVVFLPTKFLRSFVVCSSQTSHHFLSQPIVP